METRGKMVIGLMGGALLALSFSLVSASELTDKCDSCHGKNGNSKDDPADKYKPKDGEETDMQEIANKLSDEQIKEVAKHYAAQKFIPHKQPFDAKLAKKGAKVHKKRCEKCHSDNGSNAEDDAAILAGQWKGYLKRQFDLILSKERTVPKKMRKKMKKLKPGDVEALIEFYASQQ